MEELRIEAEKLAEKRRRDREMAMEWTREVRIDSDEEKEKKVRKPRKNKGDVGTGDEAEPKKKRRGKLKKGTDGEGEDEPEDQAMFTEDEDVERPAKKVFPLEITCSLLRPSSDRRKSELFVMTRRRNQVLLVKSNSELASREG